MAAQTIDMTGFREFQKKLDGLMTTNPRMKESIQSIIRRVLKEVRKNISSDAQAGLDMSSDPRKAYKAVRSSVYKRIFGGQVNILSKRRAGQPTNYQKPRKGLPKRGGNRWGRSDRTNALEGYQGTDRGFVLRFLNAGTQDRGIISYTDKGGDRHDLRSASSQNVKTHAFTGNRGSIRARNWFGQKSHKELEAAVSNLQRYIDELILEEFIV